MTFKFIRNVKAKQTHIGKFLGGKADCVRYGTVPSKFACSSHFSNVGKNLAKSVPKTTWLYMHYLRNRISNSIVLADTDPKEV